VLLGEGAVHKMWPWTVEEVVAGSAAAEQWAAEGGHMHVPAAGLLRRGSNGLDLQEVAHQTGLS